MDLTRLTEAAGTLSYCYWKIRTFGLLLEDSPTWQSPTIGIPTGQGCNISTGIDTIKLSLLGIRGIWKASNPYGHLRTDNN